MTFQEREFTALGAQLSGKLWGSDGGQPVLALHGWMDNAGSFDMLAPLLDQYQILAIDSIGHGRSEHFPDGHVYNCLLYTSPSPRDATLSRMPSSA